MDQETFILRCQEHMNEEFDALKCGDLFIDNDRGKLRIEFCPYAKDKSIEKVSYSAPGVFIEVRPGRGVDGEPDYQHMAVQLAFLIILRWERRGKEIERIEHHITQLETIRKAPVFYKRVYSSRPFVSVMLEGSEIVLLNVYGSGIKYQPSRTARGGLFRRLGHEDTVQNVADIAAVPITEYAKISERRCGSRRMDIFVSENVRYEADEESDFGWIVIGNSEQVCAIKRISPEKTLCDLTQAIEEHPDFVDLQLFTFGNVKAEVHTEGPLKGLLKSAGVTIHSHTDKSFAVWFCVNDNARVTCTCALNDISRKAVQIIEDHMRPIQLEA